MDHDACFDLCFFFLFLSSLRAALADDPSCCNGVLLWLCCSAIDIARPHSMHHFKLWQNRLFVDAQRQFIHHAIDRRCFLRFYVHTITLTYCCGIKASFATTRNQPSWPPLCCRFKHSAATRFRHPVSNNPLLFARGLAVCSGRAEWEISCAVRGQDPWQSLLTTGMLSVVLIPPATGITAIRWAAACSQCGRSPERSCLLLAPSELVPRASIAEWPDF